jgi:hypothetical protein
VVHHHHVPRILSIQRLPDQRVAVGYSCHHTENSESNSSVGGKLGAIHLRVLLTLPHYFLKNPKNPSGNLGRQWVQPKKPSRNTTQPCQPCYCVRRHNCVRPEQRNVFEHYKTKTVGHCRLASLISVSRRLPRLS